MDPNKRSVLKGKSVDNSEISFFSVINKIFEEYPDKIAIINEDSSSGYHNKISYKCLNNMSNRFAKVLSRYCSSSIFDQKYVAVTLKPTEFLPIVLLAIIKSGFSYLPIDTESPKDRIKHILQDSKPSLCIIEQKDDEEIYKGFPILDFNELVHESESETNEFTLRQNNTNIALALYTSGSTGTPKGVKLPFSALMNRLLWQWRELPYKQNEEYCIFKTALTFVDSVCEIWSPLLQGRTMVVIPRYITKNPEKLIDILNRYKIQRIVLVPSLLKSLLMCLRVQKNSENLKHLKLWICSGETLSAPLVKEFFQYFNDDEMIMANFYGSTEVMGDVTYYLFTKNDKYLEENTVPIGFPVDNCIIYIVDKNLHILRNGEVGEMLVAGKNLAEGYINDSISYKFAKNPFNSDIDFSKIFLTGDFAKIDNGQVIYEGRQDNQIKIRGHRIDITEVEGVISKLPIINEVVVLPYGAADLEKILLCFAVPKNKMVDVKDIKSQLQKSLLSYMVPNVIIVETIPLLTNGKTDRQRLFKLYESSKKNEQSAFDFTGVPENYFERAYCLYSTIASTIELEDKRSINLKSNFYELGGNSLNSVYTVLRLQENGFYISITDFITAKTLKDILFCIQDTEKIIKEECEESQEFVLQMLNNSHKEKAIEMITESFINKADLERWLLPDIKKDDYDNLMQQLWNPLVQKNFSFVVKSAKDDTILSVALNFDARDEPDVTIDSKLYIVFDFLEFLEGPIREERLPKGKNKIFHTFMMATSDDLGPAENVMLMKFMEQKCLEIAKKNSFSGILTTNTSPLTQQLGTDVFDYEVMLDYQVNKYVAKDGTKPFEKAPDAQRCVVSWKKIK